MQEWMECYHKPVAQCARSVHCANKRHLSMCQKCFINNLALYAFTCKPHIVMSCATKAVIFFFLDAGAYAPVNFFSWCSAVTLL